MQKRCVYHVPYPIKKESNAASAIRPRKMLEAFQRQFEEVFVISGYGRERKQRLKELKRRVSNGDVFEFLYSENSTMPNLMTEKNHMPYFPFLERDIFRFCKRHGIPIGLFYRDVYWRFPVYKQKVAFWKRCISLPLYHYDLAIYNKYIDILYLPSMEMGKYVPFGGRKQPLPPGNEGKRKCSEMPRRQRKSQIELFYVGGIGGEYDVSKLIEGVGECKFTHLTICCRKEEWGQWLKESRIAAPDNITIVHESADGLKKYYAKADLGILFFSASGYRKMAMPVKLFEYMENLLPIVATSGCEAGKFVEEHEIGWAINYEKKDLVRLLSDLNEDRTRIHEKYKKLLDAAEKNTWDSRAMTVCRNLNIHRAGGETDGQF